MGRWWTRRTIRSRGCKPYIVSHFRFYYISTLISITISVPLYNKFGRWWYQRLFFGLRFDRKALVQFGSFADPWFLERSPAMATYMGFEQWFTWWFLSSGLRSSVGYLMRFILFVTGQLYLYTKSKLVGLNNLWFLLKLELHYGLCSEKKNCFKFYSLENTF